MSLLGSSIFLSGLSFGAPWLGAAALLGVPAVVAIHFLHRPAKPQVVSTLFLLERLIPESAGGNRWHRLRQSWPFWLQLLAVLLLAWILARPQWFQPDSSQTVVVVLDSSVSMRAFETRWRTGLPERLRVLAKAAGHTEWILLESDPAAGRLYAGSDLGALGAQLKAWQPRLGTHDPRPVLQLAQALVKAQGMALYVTDRAAEVPAGVARLAVGAPVENAGFAGARADAEGWEALLKNYGTQPQTRSWWVEDGGGRRTEAQSITLVPGQVETLRGRFPAGEEAIRVVLSEGDAFALDDVLPLVRAVPKPLRVLRSGPGEAPWLETFLHDAPAFIPVAAAGEAGTAVAGEVDLAFTAYDLFAPKLPEGTAVVWVYDPARATKLVAGAPVAERHPLMQGLNWHGLMVTETVSIPAKLDDQVLLWLGARPLIFLRGKQLFLNFDPAKSNAAKLPALVLLLHRYAEQVREGVPTLEVKNVELNQKFNVASRGGALHRRLGLGNGLAPVGRSPAGGAAALPLAPGEAMVLRAPSEPGFFEITEGNEVRLRAAAYFADLREADFREASSEDGLDELASRQRELHSRADGLTALWILLLGGVIVASWSVKEGRGLR